MSCKKLKANSLYFPVTAVYMYTVFGSIERPFMQLAYTAISRDECENFEVLFTIFSSRL